MAAVLLAAGCAQRDPLPPWDQDVQFAQAIAYFPGVRVVDKRILAWETGPSEVPDDQGPLRIDQALLWFEIYGNSQGRYLVVDAIRPSRRGNGTWMPSPGIAHNLIEEGGPKMVATRVWRHQFFTSPPTSEELLRVARWIRFSESADRHLMPYNWRFVTGESPPTL
jgi:hypothetical protein